MVRTPMTSLCLAAGLLGGVASSQGDIIDIGTFLATGTGLQYEGAFAEYISYHVEGQYNQYAVVSINLSGLLLSLDRPGFMSVSVIDTGNNTYTTAPGADMDLFAFSNLTAGTNFEFEYDGPVELHQNETAEQLAQRMAYLDWGQNGGQLHSMEWVSLGMFGRVTANFAGNGTGGEGGGEGGGGEGQIGGYTFEPPDPGNPGGGGGYSGDPVILTLSEAGSPEMFRVEVYSMAAIPAPGAGVLLALAGMIGRGRRRRI